MSQVDFVIYLPLLFWFLIFFIIFYILLYIYIIPLLYSALKVRQLFFISLISDLSFYNFLLDLFKFNEYTYFKKLNLILLKYSFLIKYFWHYQNIKNIYVKKDK
jgi:hypothetical protein